MTDNLPPGFLLRDSSSSLTIQLCEFIVTPCYWTVKNQTGSKISQNLDASFAQASTVRRLSRKFWERICRWPRNSRELRTTLTRLGSKHYSLFPKVWLNMQKTKFQTGAQLRANNINVLTLIAVSLWVGTEYWVAFTLHKEHSLRLSPYGIAQRRLLLCPPGTEKKKRRAHVSHFFAICTAEHGRALARSRM